jgi:HlyD family secretion protein
MRKFALMRTRRGRPLLIALTALAAVGAWVGSARSAPEPNADSAAARSIAGAVSALGRIEPEHGIRRIGGPSTPASVSGSILRELLVEAGDDVKRGQVLAVLETASQADAAIAVARAQLTAAERESDAALSRVEEACALSDVAGRTSVRRNDLMKKGLASKEEADVASGDARVKTASCAASRTAAVAARANVEVAKAEIARFESELERAHIRAPMDGRVLEIIRRPGELVYTEGILELGNVSRMYAIAEVYETDVRRVKLGQKATISSRALDKPLSGTVERIRQKVHKQDQIGTDPAAQKDARIVEVEVLLDNPAAVAMLSNLQVEVLIRP